MISLKNKALYFLSKRDYAYLELFDKLKRYCDDEKEIHAVLEHLVENKYLSDERYIHSYLNSKSGRISLQKIRYELIQKTGKHELVDAILDEVKDKFDQYGIVYQIWEKKFGVKASTQKELIKQIRYLQYKGFNLGVIYQIVK